MNKHARWRPVLGGLSWVIREFHIASDCCARHNYGGALAVLQTLSTQPQISHDPAARAFLEQQVRFCRHALDPYVSLAAAVLPPTPALSRRADCGPRALLRVCHTYDGANEQGMLSTTTDADGAVTSYGYTRRMNWRPSARTVTQAPTPTTRTGGS